MRILVIDLLDNVWILQREVTKSFLVDKELKDYTIVDYYYYKSI